MRETSVSKGTGETAGDGDEGEGPENTTRRDDGRHGGALWCREKQVYRTDGRSK